MKITKHMVGREDDRGCRIVIAYRKTEEMARKYADKWNLDYLGKKEIDMRCNSCGVELKIGDKYLKVDEDTRYCSDCYEEEQRTLYKVDDEYYYEDEAVEFDEEDTEVDQ